MTVQNIPRTYNIVTLGCKMNVHDSERIAGLLEQSGLVSVDKVPEALKRATVAGDRGADVVVLNTCSVRENAANKLFGHLGQLASVKQNRPGMQIAVGGCLAQQMRQGIIDRAPCVDAVFGTHNIDVLPALLKRAEHNNQAAVEIEESLKVFPSTLPTKRESVYAAWVSISVGCNNTCTFCIVPHLRGKERDRRPGDIMAEVEAVLSQGAIEVTLLGQNVNSYGVSFGQRGAFAKLLSSVGRIEGLERLRFTSPHPAAFSDDVIDAMATTPTVMPNLHMPLQSGSNNVLKAMRRSYRRDKFLNILAKVRDRIPEANITTDIIVGFPGETDSDFQQTMDLIEEARFASAYTFIYSPRPGTPAADMENQVDPDIISERYNRLLKRQKEISYEENLKLVGKEVEVLIAEGEGRKDEKRHRLSGRAADNRLVHFTLPENIENVPRPGDMVKVKVTQAAPHYLIADSAINNGLFDVRKTRAGDVWEKSQNLEKESKSNIVSLGIPTIRVGRV